MTGPEKILRSVRSIAVVGIHNDPERPAFYVPEYLHRNGYQVYGVNPMKKDVVLFGEPVRSSLGELAAPIDMVVLFRRSADVIAHLGEILAMTPLPRFTWLQLGIRNREFAEALTARGIEVVSDRCTLADHRAFGIGAVG